MGTTRNGEGASPPPAASPGRKHRTKGERNAHYIRALTRTGLLEFLPFSILKDITLHTLSLLQLSNPA